jgi:SP family arabinose:H+ symporter-like MFS transporter
MGLSLHLILMSLAAGLAGNFQLGYLASVLTQSYVAIEQYMNASWVERSGEPITRETLTLLMSILNITNPVAQIIGQLVALFICNRIGRKNTALVGCGIIFPGVLLSLFAKWLQPAFEVLFVGRILWSMADGILVVNQTIWLVEAAPAKYRGSVSSMQEVFAAFGKSFETFVDFTWGEAISHAARVINFPCFAFCISSFYSFYVCIAFSGALTTLAFGVPFSSDELWPP